MEIGANKGKEPKQSKKILWLVGVVIAFKTGVDIRIVPALVIRHYASVAEGNFRWREERHTAWCFLKSVKDKALRWLY